MEQASGVKAPKQPAPVTSDGTQAIGYVLAGVLIWGLLGKLLDGWLAMSFFTPLGLALGWVLGSYLTYVRVIRAPGADSGEIPTGTDSDMDCEGKGL